MYTIYNEHGEIYSESYTEEEAQEKASEINGHYRYTDTSSGAGFEWEY